MTTLTVYQLYDRLRDRLQRLGGDVQIIAHQTPEIGTAESPQGDHLLVVRIYTLLKSYQIKAVARDGSDGYLGCTMSARRARPGEDWTRGNDLADGPLTENTLMRIYEDILGCEMVRFDDECRHSGRPVTLGPSDEASCEDDVAREAEQRWRES